MKNEEECAARHGAKPRIGAGVEAGPDAKSGTSNIESFDGFKDRRHRLSRRHAAPFPFFPLTLVAANFRRSGSGSRRIAPSETEIRIDLTAEER
jgi:hypothetical protein